MVPEESCIGSILPLLQWHPEPEVLSPVRFSGKAKRRDGHDATTPFFNGAEGNRTLDLLNAIQALSQLSYGPVNVAVAIIRDCVSQDY